MKDKHLRLNGLAKWAIRQSLGTVRGNEIITLIDKILWIGYLTGKTPSVGSITQTLDNKSGADVAYFLTVDKGEED
jgi:hypothetical protein